MDKTLLTLLLLLEAACLLCLAHPSLRVVGVLGQPVFLKPSLTPSVQVRDAIWRSHSPAEELVAVSFKGTPEILYQSRFFGRIRLHPNLTLELRPVGLGDGGEFSVLLVDSTGKVEHQRFRLEVYGTLSRRKRDVATLSFPGLQFVTRATPSSVEAVVSTPTIRVFSEESNQNSSAGSCVLFLTCVASRGTNISYIWLNSEGKSLAKDTHSVFENGQVLWARLNLTEDTRTYTCIAANKASQESATISIWDHCRKLSDAKDSVFDYRNILLIVVPLASLFLSAAAILIIRSKRHSELSWTGQGKERRLLEERCLFKRKRMWTSLNRVLNNYVAGWTDWNLALDLNGGPNYINNFVDSPIIVNASNDEFYKQPMFYHMAHFSKFIPEGCVRVSLKQIAWPLCLYSVDVTCPDGSAVYILNECEASQHVCIFDEKLGYIQDTISMKSIQTYVWKRP